MKTDNLQRFLNSFGKNVIKQSRASLARNKKNVSKELYNSLRFEVEEDGENFTVKFFMLGYGTFVDKGVSGNKTIQQYKSWTGKTQASPFKYTNKMPPPSMLDKWIVKKGLAPREKGGQFTARKSLQFLIARKIKLHGIKSISFFQRPLGLALETFGKDLLESVGKDLTATIDGVTKDFPTQNN